MYCQSKYICFSKSILCCYCYMNNTAHDGEHFGVPAPSYAPLVSDPAKCRTNNRT